MYHVAPNKNFAEQVSQQAQRKTLGSSEQPLVVAAQKLLKGLKEAHILEQLHTHYYEAFESENAPKDQLYPTIEDGELEKRYQNAKHLFAELDKVAVGCASRLPQTAEQLRELAPTIEALAPEENKTQPLGPLIDAFLDAAKQPAQQMAR